MVKRWLITGGCGFIGTSLIRALGQEGTSHIRIVDNLSVGTREDLSAVCRFREADPDRLSTESWSGGEPCLIVGDIRSLALANQAAAGADIVVHLAANAGVAQSVKDPHFDCTTNVIGTLNYLDACRRNNVKRFIFASSGAAVGECEPPIDEQKVPHPASPYGASKLAGEGYCSAYHSAYGVEAVCLRFGNVYGPGSKHKSSVVAKFIKQILNGETLDVFGDGAQSRDYVYIEDLVRAILAVSEKDAVGGETFQIATGRETTVLELLERLQVLAKSKALGEVRVLHSSARSGDVRRNFSDTSKARRLLEWRATMNLDDGLSRTFDWFMS